MKLSIELARVHHCAVIREALGSWGQHNRPLKRYSAVSQTHNFVSRKNNWTMYCNSSAELAFAYLLEADPDVVCFQSQPFTIEYQSEPKKLQATPDFALLTRKDELQCYEIKPQDYVSEPQEETRLEKISAALAEKSYQFNLSKLDYDDPYIKALAETYPDSQTPFDGLVNRFAGYEGSLADLLVELPDSAHAQVNAALFHGAIKFDRTKPLKVDSFVSFKDLK